MQIKILKKFLNFWSYIVQIVVLITIGLFFMVIGKA